MYDAIYDSVIAYPQCYHLFDNFDRYSDTVIMYSGGYCYDKFQFLDFVSYYMPSFVKIIDRMRVISFANDDDFNNIMRHIKMERVRKNNKLSYNNPKHHKRLRSIVRHGDTICLLCMEIFTPRTSPTSSSSTSDLSSVESSPVAVDQPQPLTNATFKACRYTKG